MKNSRKFLSAFMVSCVCLCGTVSATAGVQLPDGGSTSEVHDSTVWGYTSGGSLGKERVTCQLSVFSGTPITAYNGISYNISSTNVRQSITVTYKLSGDSATYTKTENFPLTNMGTSLSHVLEIQLPNNTSSVSKYTQYNYTSVDKYGTWRSYNYVLP